MSIHIGGCSERFTRRSVIWVYRDLLIFRAIRLLVMVPADGVKKVNDLLEISLPTLTLFQELCYEKEKLVKQLRD